MTPGGNAAFGYGSKQCPDPLAPQADIKVRSPQGKGAEVGLTAILDTGATTTCIPPSLAEQLSILDYGETDVELGTGVEFDPDVLCRFRVRRCALPGSRGQYSTRRPTPSLGGIS